MKRRRDTSSSEEDDAVPFLFKTEAPPTTFVSAGKYQTQPHPPPPDPGIDELDDAYTSSSDSSIGDLPEADEPMPSPPPSPPPLAPDQREGLEATYGVGFAMLSKMGYAGGGLGKRGTGRIEPPEVRVRGKFEGIQSSESASSVSAPPLKKPIFKKIKPRGTGKKEGDGWSERFVNKPRGQKSDGGANAGRSWGGASATHDDKAQQEEAEIAAASLRTERRRALAVKYAHMGESESESEPEIIPVIPMTREVMNINERGVQQEDIDELVELQTALAALKKSVVDLGSTPVWRKYCSDSKSDTVCTSVPMSGMRKSNDASAGLDRRRIESQYSGSAVNGTSEGAFGMSASRYGMYENPAVGEYMEENEDVMVLRMPVRQTKPENDPEKGPEKEPEKEPRSGLHELTEEVKEIRRKFAKILDRKIRKNIFSDFFLPVFKIWLDQRRLEIERQSALREQEKKGDELEMAGDSLLEGCKKDLIFWRFFISKNYFKKKIKKIIYFFFRDFIGQMIPPISEAAAGNNPRSAKHKRLSRQSLKKTLNTLDLIHHYLASIKPWILPNTLRSIISNLILPILKSTLLHQWNPTLTVTHPILYPHIWIHTWLPTFHLIDTSQDESEKSDTEDCSSSDDATSDEEPSSQTHVITRQWENLVDQTFIDAMRSFLTTQWSPTDLSESENLIPLLMPWKSSFLDSKNWQTIIEEIANAVDNWLANIPSTLNAAQIANTILKALQLFSSEDWKPLFPASYCLADSVALQMLTRLDPAGLTTVVQSLTTHEAARTFQQWKLVLAATTKQKECETFLKRFLLALRSSIEEVQVVAPPERLRPAEPK